MSNIEKLDYEYCEKTIELKHDIEKNFMELGRRLYHIREERKYEPQYHSFGEFIQELKMSQATVSKLINIYEKFVLEYHISPVKLSMAGGWSILAEALPVVQSKEQAQNFVDSATGNTRENIRAMITEGKTGKSQMDCKHENIYTVEVCRDCKLKTVHEKE